MESEETVVLYRPAGAEEIKLVEGTNYRRWPPRLPGQPIFYPVTNLEYAIHITERWNGADYGEGFVTKFYVRKEFMDRYPVQQVGASNHTEWWVPAEDLEELNDNIVGKIDVVHHYKAPA